jgi:hypothetical protein
MMVDNNADLTPEEMAELQAFLKQAGLGTGFPNPERDKGMVGFFRDLLDITRIKNVIRGSNLLENEIVASRLLLDTAHYSDAMGLDKVSSYLDEKAFIIADTSLGRGGFLVSKAVTSKHESVNKIGELEKKKSSWFSKKEKED